jgi:hypothetical protein
MTTRHAACSCGQLRITTDGEPVRISMCHCLECQRRTGSTYGVQARFGRQSVRTEGRATAYERIADSGQRITFHFCPECGSTVWYWQDANPEVVAIPIGAFADPDFPPPTASVWEARRHAWSGIPAQAEHSD